MREVRYSLAVADDLGFRRAAQRTSAGPGAIEPCAARTRERRTHEIVGRSRHDPGPTGSAFHPDARRPPTAMAGGLVLRGLLIPLSGLLASFSAAEAPDEVKRLGAQSATGIAAPDGTAFGSSANPRMARYRKAPINRGSPKKVK